MLLKLIDLFPPHDIQKKAPTKQGERNKKDKKGKGGTGNIPYCQKNNWTERGHELGNLLPSKKNNQKQPKTANQIPAKNQKPTKKLKLYPMAAFQMLISCLPNLKFFYHGRNGVAEPLDLKICKITRKKVDVESKRGICGASGWERKEWI